MATGADLSKLSISQLHELTGRDRRWIKQRLADEAVDSVGEDGRTFFFAPRAALAAIYGTEQISASGEKARLDRTRRELAELELAERRREQAPIAEMEEAGVRFLTGVRTMLLAIGSTNAQELAASDEPAECADIVNRSIHEALAAIAQPEIVVAQASGRAREDLAPRH